jgi:hypothetical protein
MNVKINENYSDVLYWVISPMTKDKEYHLTYTQEAILRKLIHYEKSSKFINYTNETIYSHTYVSVENLKKIIPKLNRLGFISISNKKHLDNGEFKTSRTITINWNFINNISAELPKKSSKNKESYQPKIKKYNDSDIIELEDFLNNEIGFSIEDTEKIMFELQEFEIIFSELKDKILLILKNNKYNDGLKLKLTETIKSNLKKIFDFN